MKIRFIEYVYPEDWNFEFIIRRAGLAHEVDVDEVVEKIWDRGTRELQLVLELDTETGIIEVVK
jgi:hypothetical protein